MTLKLLLIGAYPDSVSLFRGDLIRELVRAGHSVTVMTAPASAEVRAEIETTGAVFRPYAVERNGLNPLKDLRTLRELRTAVGEIGPDVIFAYTIKPIIWGGLATRLSGKVRFFAMVTGLGFAFQGGSLKRRALGRLVVLLYRAALRRCSGVIFQNPDNRDVFVDRGIVPGSRCEVVNGSGVNTEFFSVVPLPPGPPRFILIARLLGEKGIREYAEAARMVRNSYPEAVFDLVGPEDPSPDGLSSAEVSEIRKAGDVRYHGASTDVRPFVKDCHVYVLPSYHEGMPRTVLEAMSMGRPILTTDTVGCRETVVPGENGWLVPVADPESLARRMIWFIENRDHWGSMSTRSRELAVHKFDVRRVNERMLEILGITER